MTRGEVLWRRESGLIFTSLYVERDQPMPEVVLSIRAGVFGERSDVHLSRREARALADALTEWLGRPPVTGTRGEQLDAITRDMDATTAAWVAAGYPLDGPEADAREAVFARLRQWNEATS